MTVQDVCFVGYGLHPPWSEGTRVLTRDEMRSLADHSEFSVRGFSTRRGNEEPARDIYITYVNESVVGDVVDAFGGYRYNLDVPMLSRLV
ncbi:MAG: hypothetical protein ABEI86_11975, partial [Halobacteriaceae archaeon]